MITIIYNNNILSRYAMCRKTMRQLVVRDLKPRAHTCTIVSRDRHAIFIKKKRNNSCNVYIILLYASYPDETRYRHSETTWGKNTNYNKDIINL